MGRLFTEITSNEILKDIPLIVLTKTQIKISGIKIHQNSTATYNIAVLVSLYHTRGYIKRQVTTNDVGYWEMIFEKKDLPIGKYQVRYDGTGYRAAVKPLGDWDIIDITREMVISTIDVLEDYIGVQNLKGFVSDGERLGGDYFGQLLTNRTMLLTWDDYREMLPSTFPKTVFTHEGTDVRLSYEQAMAIENYIVFMFVTDTLIYPPNQYPVDNISPSRWVIVGETKSKELTVPLANKKYFSFWVGAYLNLNLFDDSFLPTGSYTKKSF